MIIKFYGREMELKLLREVKRPFLAIIYGRRRLGKTTLALKFAEKEDYVYFFVNPKKTEALLMEEFVSILKEKMNLPSYISPKNWDEFFELLFEYKEIVIFDEFQWFLKINKSVPYILQKFWDTKQKKPTIILLGSVIGMLKKLFREEGSPLFKRAEIIIHLKELNISSIFQMLEDIGIKNLEEKFKFYLIFGGVPYYYTLLAKYSIKSVEEAIEKLIVEENAPLRKEVEEVIIEAFKRNFTTYLSILFAIASGKTKFSEIASTVGIKPTSLSPYLYDLSELLGLIERHEVGSKKKGIYQIKDKFHAFWLRYVYKNVGVISKEELVKKIKEDINSFFGWSFEVTCREIFNTIFKDFKTARKYYGIVRNGERRVFDIDIFSLSNDERKIVLGECKWEDGVDAVEILKVLKERENLIKEVKNREVVFVIFAKNFSRRIEKFNGRKVYCFDLNDLLKSVS